MTCDKMLTITAHADFSTALQLEVYEVTVQYIYSNLRSLYNATTSDHLTVAIKDGKYDTT